MIKKLQSVLIIIPVIMLSYGMSSSDKLSDSNEQIQKTDHKEASYTKPHAGIELNYNSLKPVKVGESIVLDLQFTTRTQAESLIVNIRHDDGLQLDSQDAYQFSTTRAAKHAVNLQLTGLKQGNFIVDVSAEIISNGQSQVRTFAIPIIVGDPVSNKSTEDNNAASKYRSIPSQGVVSMPATETQK